VNLLLDALADALRSHRFSYSSEDELQRGIGEVLARDRFHFEREFRLTEKDRPDFMVWAGENRARPSVAVEVKIGGTLPQVTRQLHRYAQHEKVDAMLLVTSRFRLSGLPERINDKALRVFNLGAGGLL